MSSIDNRIVQMQFENSQFEKGVQQSMDSIEKLEDSLQFKKAEKGLQSLQKAGDSFSLAQMAKGIEKIEEKFSVMGIVGKRIIEDLTDSAVRMGEQFVKSITTDQISSGWNKYAQKTEAVQTIIAATGKDIDYVEAQLEKLNWFTDETSYDFVDMTSNIGKFTSMGIDLETSVTAMQGIATWAAVSGQNAQTASRAMYNMSQAIGVGSVKLMDWKSIENANMATKEFKQTAIDTAKALGKLNAQGKTAKGTAVTFENFSQTLSEGWFTKDVLLKTLDKYGEYANKVYEIATEKGIPASEAMELITDDTMKLGEKAFKAAQEAKTFADAINSVKDAVSTGWMNIFQDIFGNYEEAKELWTDLANYLWDMFAAPLSNTHELLAEWNKLGGRKELLQGIYDIFEGIANIVQTVKDSIAEIFPPVTVENLQNISHAVAEFGKNFKETFSRTEEVDGVVYKKIADPVKQLIEEGNFALGQTGENVMELQQKLVELGWLEEEFANGIYNPATQKAVEDFNSGLDRTSRLLNTSLKMGDKGKEVEELQKKLKELGFDPGGVDGIWGKKTQKAFDAYKASLGKTEKSYKELRKGMKGEDVKQLQQALIDAKLLDEGQADGIFGPKTEAALKKYQKAHGIIESGILDEKTFKHLFPDLSGVGDEYEQEYTYVTKYSTTLEKLKGIVQGLSAAVDILRQFFGFLGKVIGHIGTLLAPFGDALLTIGASLGLNIQEFDEWLKTSGTFDKWFEDVKAFLEPFGKWVKDASNNLLEFLGLSEGVTKIDFQKVGENFVNAIKGLLGIKIDASEVVDNIETEGIVEKIKGKIVEVYTSVRDWIVSLFSGTKPENGEAALPNFDMYNLAISGIMLVIGILSTRLLSAIGVVVKAGKGVNKVIKNVNGILSGVKNEIRFKGLETVAGAIKDFAIAIGILAAAVWVLSQLSWDQIAVGLAGLGVIMIALAGSLFLMKKASDKFENIDKVMNSLLILALSIGILGLVVTMLAQLSWEQLGKGLAGIAVLLAMSLVAIHILSKQKVDTKEVGGTIGLIGALAFNLNALVGVIRALGSMDPKTLIQGFIGMAAVMIAVALFLKAASKIKVEWSTVAALVAAALAIDLVIAGFLVLAFAMKLLSPMDIVKAVVGMIAIVLVIALLMALIDKIDPSIRTILALIPVALALDLVIIGFIALAVAMKHMTVGDILKGVAGMIIVIGAITALLAITRSIKPSITGILALIPIAAALDIAILGFVVLAFAAKGMTWGDILKAVAGMIIVIGAITALLAVTKFIKPSIKGIIGLIPIVLAMNIAIIGFIALALAMKAVTWDDLLKTIVAFGVIALSLAVLSATMSATTTLKGAIGMIVAMIAMAGAMVAFAVVLNYVKNVNTKKILAFATGLSEIMLSFGALAVISKAAGLKGILLAAGAIIAVSAAVGLVIAAFGALNKIPGFADFMKGGAATIGQIIGTIVEEIEAAKFKGMAKGMSALSSADYDIDKDKLDGVLDIATAFSEFNSNLPDRPLVEKLIPWAKTNMDLTMHDMESFAKGITIFAEGMKDFSIEDYDTVKIEEAEQMVSDFAAFNDALPEESTADRIITWVTGQSKLESQLSDMEGFAKGIAKFAMCMPLVTAGLTLYNSEDMKEAMQIVTDFAEFNGGLPQESTVDRIVSWVTGKTNLDTQLAGMESFAKGIGRFALYMPLVTAGLTGYNSEDMKEAMQIVTDFAEFNGGLPQESTVDRIVSWVTGKTNLDTQLSGMESFAKGIGRFALYMPLVTAGLKGYNSEDMKEAMQIVTDFAEFNGGLPQESTVDRIVSWVTGQSNLDTQLAGMESFAIGIGKFAYYMPLVSSGAGEYNDEDMKKAMGIVTDFANFSKGLPSASIGDRLLKWIGVGSNLDSTMYDMESFASGFNKFSQAMSGITWTEDLETDTGNAITIATNVADFLVKLNGLSIDKKKGAVQAWFTEGTSQETVFDSIGTLADSMVNNKDKFKGLGKGSFVEDVKAATKAAMYVAGFLNYISADDFKVTDNVDQGWQGYTSSFDILSQNIGTLGDRMQDFATKTKDIDLGVVSSAITSVTGFLDLVVNGTPEIGTNGVLSFLDSKDISDKLASVIATVSQEFTNAGLDLAASVSDGLAAGDLSNGINSLITDTVHKLDSQSKVFEIPGGNFAIGLANGIAFNAYVAVEAAREIARRMIEAVNRAFDSHSPSRVAQKIGGYFTEGLAIGTTDKVNEATNAAEKVAGSMLSSASGTLATLSSLLADDIDVNPVISPVVDLTNARQSAAMIGGLFGNQSIGVTSSVLAKDAMVSTNNGRPITIQNGTMSTTESLSGVTDQLNALNSYLTARNDGPQLSEMQVLGEKFGDLADAVSNLKIVLDTGTLVGEITPALDAGLGNYATLRDRGN